MKKLLDLLATHGGVIVCSSYLSREQIIIANACERMYVDENGIGFVYMEEYAQSHANKDGCIFFTSNKTSSATICDNCGKEKYEHNKAQI